MKPKKNPKADLTKNSGLFFAIGLFVVMGITYIALEWKTDVEIERLDFAMDVDESLEEEAPLVQMSTPPPPPPPPPPAPVVIEIVKNEAKVVEVKIESTDLNNEEVMEIDDIEVLDEPVEVNVPFTIIEEVPVFPGCERKKKKDQRDCFNQKMQKHIRKHFRYPEIAKEMGIQGRVNVGFVIDKNGAITGIKARGPDKNLEKEAVRIISLLPKMKPGKQRGKSVRVPFGIPITFRLQ